jgi:hypothetical protein
VLRRSASRPIARRVRVHGEADDFCSRHRRVHDPAPPADTGSDHRRLPRAAAARTLRPARAGAAVPAHARGGAAVPGVEACRGLDRGLGMGLHAEFLHREGACGDGDRRGSLVRVSEGGLEPAEVGNRPPVPRSGGAVPMEQFAVCVSASTGGYAEAMSISTRWHRWRRVCSCTGLAGVLARASSCVCVKPCAGVMDRAVPTLARAKPCLRHAVGTSMTKAATPPRGGLDSEAATAVALAGEKGRHRVASTAAGAAAADRAILAPVIYAGHLPTSASAGAAVLCQVVSDTRVPWSGALSRSALSPSTASAVGGTGDGAGGASPGRRCA